MMIQERFHTLPTDGLRFAYADAEILSCVKKNIECIDSYIEQQEKTAREFASKSGGADMPIEKIVKIGANGISSLRWEAQMAVRAANLSQHARTRREWYVTIRDHGVFTKRHEDGRALLSVSEVNVIITPFNAESLEAYEPAPMYAGGLGTAMRGIPPVMEPVGQSLADAAGSL